MAIAGLHNVSAFGPFFRESQSNVSSPWSDEPGTPRTRASLLKMWRELEGDDRSHRSRARRIAPDTQSLGPSSPVAQGNDNGHDDAETQAVMGSEIDHDDGNSIVSEQSSDLGETERERVRQIFQEWMNSGSIGHSSNDFHLNNRQWLGENECERVRVIREWVQMNAQQRNDHASREGGGEAISPIEQVREGLVVNHPEPILRRPLRRLCGRQTLLDLLQRAQCERKEELQGLLEHRPVSDFSHRNRIQALLRGRFLRNETMVADTRPSSVAATELGLLRQRHTVSGLREGFISKLENSATTSANSAETDSLSSDQNHSELESTFQEREMSRNFGLPHMEGNVDGNELESTFQEREMSRNFGLPHMEGNVDGNESQQELEREFSEVENQVVHNVSNQEDFSSINEGNVQELSSHIDVNLRDSPVDVGSVQTAESQISDGDSSDQVSIIEETGNRHIEEINVTPLDHYESRSSVSHAEEAVIHTTDLNGNMDEQDDRSVNSAQLDDYQYSINGESMASSWQERSSGNVVFQETSEIITAEQDQIQESQEEWPSHDLQEAIDSWLGTPSAEVGASVGRLDAFYYSDDENVHSIELRELFSRRRVSSLLRSGFRESLDQVLQSHMERQAHAPGDWEQDNESSSPSLVGRDPEESNSGRALDLSAAAERNSFAPASSNFVAAARPLWDEEMQGPSLPHNNLTQHFGTEWEVVNELRNDMARLQQRLNNMQNMLEQCMDMQIELQRSVRQEVSAALNRSFLTKGVSKRIPLHDESRWDSIRKGICCLCHENNIDTLLYRCGHMCTCSKCAEKLIQDTGKCPMCRAPVVESVRAYFIQ